MTEKIELNVEKNLGERLTATFRFFKQNWKNMTKGMPYLIVAYLVLSILEGINAEKTISGLFLLKKLASAGNFFVMLLIGLYITNYMNDYNDPENTDVDRYIVWDRIKSHLWGALGGSILITITVSIGFALCIIPGFLLLICLSLFFPLYVADRKKDGSGHSSVFSIIHDSYNLVAYDFLKSSVFLIITWLILIPAVFVFALFSLYLSSLSEAFFHDASFSLFFANIIVKIILSFISLAMLYLFFISLSVLYFDLKGKDEYEIIKNNIDNIGKKTEV